ncbi:hypothetical protein AAFF_G00319130 [Aldrovandia affinis]|uniref:Bromo domain-containing protein n=1 Tax=Aldrovandia affinis TaxID=143900 RepID=A0AAD7SMP7_9TELE|nr:hypothetical protein AAFF_G00319130 [Aldrovandia affinis]
MQDSLCEQEFEEREWLALYEDSSTDRETESETDTGPEARGSPAHAQTHRESLTHTDGERAGGREEGMDTEEGGQASGNTSPATHEGKEEGASREMDEWEWEREREGGVGEECPNPRSQEDGEQLTDVAMSTSTDTDAHANRALGEAGADHCVSEQGSLCSEDGPLCVTESPGRRSSSQDFRKLLRDICNDIAGHKYAELFLRPVNEKFAPHYYSVVKRPVDLQTIRRGVAKGGVDTLETLNHQLMLMFQNALMFNSAESQVYRGARAMQREVLQHVQMLIDEVQSRDQSGSSP